MTTPTVEIRLTLAESTARKLHEIAQARGVPEEALDVIVQSDVRAMGHGGTPPHGGDNRSGGGSWRATSQTNQRSLLRCPSLFSAAPVGSRF